jgi:transglutaminase-like putative cysteine protease
MAAMARSRRSDPAVRQAWGAITGSVIPPTTYDEALMLRRWLAEHFAFQPDPSGRGVFGGTEEIELLQDPLILLQQIQRSYVARGDCDDAAILGAALALGAPVPFSGVRFALVGVNPNEPYVHVYADVLTARGWCDLDVTRRSQNIPTITKREYVYV